MFVVVDTTTVSITLGGFCSHRVQATIWPINLKLTHRFTHGTVCNLPRLNSMNEACVLNALKLPGVPCQEQKTESRAKMCCPIDWQVCRSVWRPHLNGRLFYSLCTGRFASCLHHVHKQQMPAHNFHQQCNRTLKPCIWHMCLHADLSDNSAVGNMQVTVGWRITPKCTKLLC